MPAIPKPEKRGPKPRQRIARVSAKGKRSQVPVQLQEYREKEKRADGLWALIVRSLTVACERCHSRPGHDAHHLVTRTKHLTRWITVNGSHLCRHCHETVGRPGTDNELLAVSLIGMAGWQELNAISNGRGKVDIDLTLMDLDATLRARPRWVVDEAKRRGLISE